MWPKSKVVKATDHNRNFSMPALIVADVKMIATNINNEVLVHCRLVRN